MIDYGNRYQLIFAAKDPNTKELIPIWDKRVKIDESEMYGTQYYLDDIIHSKKVSLTRAVIDLKTKEISTSFQVVEDEEKKSEYSVGDSCYIEVGINTLKEVVIKGLKDRCRETLCLTKELSDPDIEKYSLDRNIPLVCYRSYDPIYVLNDGTEVVYKHKLYKKFKK